MELTLKIAFNYFLKAIPGILLVSSIVFWVDARHMHKDIADIRWIDTQILIINGQIRDYTRLNSPDAADIVYYELDADQLSKLKSERSKVLGLGGLPE